MAGPIVTGPGPERRRVFVLVEDGVVQGVFNTWDAAEAYADEHRLSLDHLMEYETRRDYPDHLHLLSAKWGDAWSFQGQWSKSPPTWDTNPEQIRLEHYLFGGGRFSLFRQKDFPYAEGLLERINPMAPDNALVIELPGQKPPPTPQWKPKLAPLKPLGPAFPPAGEDSEPAAPAGQPAETAQVDEPAGHADFPPEGLHPDAAVDEPQSGEPPVRILPKIVQQQGKGFPPLPPKEAPFVPKPAEPIRLKPTPEPEASTTPAGPGPGPETDAAEDMRPKPRISFQKAPSLRLKSKPAPQPIPSFKPATAAPVDLQGNVSSVELAYADLEARERQREETEQPVSKPRRIWSLRLIISVAMLIVCWVAGLLWALRPEPTAAAVIGQVASLRSATLRVLEPETVYFQMAIDPIYQERWIESLKLQPLPRDVILTLPTYHALVTWTKPEGFVRPPYALVEVDEWLDLRLRRIEYGFTHRWPDGTILVLDLESDMLIGWGKARRFPELLN